MPIDTDPLTAHIALLQTLLDSTDGAHPARDYTLAAVITGLSSYRDELDKHECEAPDPVEPYCSLAEAVR